MPHFDYMLDRFTFIIEALGLRVSEPYESDEYRHYEVNLPGDCNMQLTSDLETGAFTGITIPHYEFGTDIVDEVPSILESYLAAEFLDESLESDQRIAARDLYRKVKEYSASMYRHGPSKGL